MIAWRRESEAGQPWATWGLLAATLGVYLAAASVPELELRLALRPADPRLVALLGHLFLHSGVLPLCATLLFVAAAGPWLELQLGKRLATASYLGAGLAGAAALAATQPGEETVWIGASAAVAGWVGLVAASARGDATDWLAVAAGRAGSLVAPGWALAALWLGAQLAAGLAGETGVVAIRAAGFGFGALLGVGLAKAGLVAREERAAPDAAASPRPRRHRAAAHVPLPSAPAQLEALLGESPDPRVARAYLAQAETERRREPARARVAASLGEALEWRQRGPAVALWCALAEAGAAPELGTDALLQLAGWLRADGHAGEASAALFAALGRADAPAAAKIARAARRADPVLCCRAAERALASEGLGASERRALEGLRLEAEREAGARGVIVVPGSLAARPRLRSGPARMARPEPPAAPRALAPGEAIELAPEPAPPGAAPESVPLALPDPEQAGEGAFLDAFHAALHAEGEAKSEARPSRRLRVREALPRALEGDALVLEVPGRGPLRLRLARIHAVALAGVRGLSERAGDKPVLLVDLCLSAEAEPELHVLRLRSDRFDPRHLAPSEERTPLAALRAFVAALAAAAHAPLLPAADVTGEAPLRIFRDLAGYEREVLGAG